MKDKPITVQVTSCDIAAGRAKDWHECPAAIAIQRATGDETATVFEHDFEIYIEVEGRSVLAPPSVYRYVRAFDAGEMGQPFAFELPSRASPEWEVST